MATKPLVIFSKYLLPKMNHKKNVTKSGKPPKVRVQFKVSTIHNVKYFKMRVGVRIFGVFQNSNDINIALILARPCGVPACGVRAVDWWQWLSGHYFHFFFFFGFFPPVFPVFFSVATFSHRRSARIKKLI